MADISNEILQFQTAVYGEEVRSSLVSVVEKINSETEDATEAERVFENRISSRQDTVENEWETYQNALSLEWNGFKVDVKDDVNYISDQVRDAQTYADSSKASANEAKTALAGATASAKSASASEKNASDSQARAYTSEQNTRAMLEQAQQIVGIGTATPTNIGLVKPDNSTITVDADGTIKAVTQEIEVINSLDSTATNKALSANMGKTLNEKATAIKGEVADIYVGGFASKNLIPFPYYSKTSTINGVLFTVNNDGTVSAKGTATANAVFNLNLYGKGNAIPLISGKKYRLSGCPNGGSSSKYKLHLYAYQSSASGLAVDYGDGVIYTANGNYTESQIWIVVYNGNTVDLTFKPMLVEVNADGTYPTNYMPYSKSNLRLTNEVDSIFSNGYASRNLIPFPYYNGTGRTHNGITYKVGDDGKISVVGGTATANSNYQLLSSLNKFILKAGHYKLITNCNKQESTSTYDMWIGVRRNSDSVYVKSQQVIGSYDFVITEDEAKSCHIAINVNVINGTADGVYWEPMLVEVNADGTYPTSYTPYAKSNIKLAKELDSIFDNGYASKNLIPFPYANPTTTNRGITYTPQSDGRVIADGTVSETTLDSFFDLTKAFTLKKGTYKFLIGVLGSPTTYWGVLYNSANTEITKSTTNDGIFTLDADTSVYVQIRVYRNKSISKISFLPMITTMLDATDGDCKKHVPSNEEIANEITNLPKRTVLTSSLASGATTLSFTNDAITANALIDIYTDKYGLNPTSVTTSGNALNLTFDAQSELVNVKVIITE